MTNNERITYFGKADYRNKLTPFGIKAEDRTRHMYVIGKTGMGKSTLLENMAVQDIQNGEGCGFIDPHGGTAELLLDYVPEHRIKDVIYFAPFDTDYPVAFNIMEDVGKDKRHLVASGLMSAFKKIWVDAWSARMEYILGNTLLALLEFPGATLLGVNRMYSDKDYRKRVVDNISDPAIKSFWVDEYAKYGDRYTQEATPAIQNKVGQFVSNPLIRNIIGQSKSTFDIRQLMDDKKIFIMNLSKGKVGDQNTSLLGSMLITKIYLSAMSRADASRDELRNLPNFYFFVDEFQSFANESFADILSEARKYKLNLTIAHQYIEQMPEEVRAAVFGNVGTMITFRVGSYDADVLEKEFLPAFSAEDIVNLDKYQLYLRLMIDGVGSKPFSAVALPPISKNSRSFKQEILENSRKMFARPRMEVEQEILEWHQMSYAAVKPAPITTSGETPRPFTPPAVSSPSGVTSGERPPYRSAQAPRPQEGGRTPAPRGEGSFVERRQFDRRRDDQRRTDVPERRRDTFERRKPEDTLPPQPIQQVPMREMTPPPAIPEAPRPAPIPLSTLRKDRSEKTPEATQNKNTLKEALQTLMAEKKGIVEKPPVVQGTVVKTPEAPTVSSIPAKEEKNIPLQKAEESPKPIPPTQNQNPKPSHVSQGNTPKEIPEEVLREMLHVDEEK